MTGDEVVNLHEGLGKLKQDARSWADQLRKFVYPYSPTSIQGKFSYLGVDINGLHDSTAVRSNERLAAAHMSYLCDQSKVWFDLKPSSALGQNAMSGGAVKWLRECAEAMAQALVESNFYTVVHQAILDRCAFGTGCFYGGMSNEGKLMFKYVPFDFFCFSEDEYGLPSTLIREEYMTAEQALGFFRDKMRLSEDMRKSLDDAVERRTKTYCILHAVIKNCGEAGKPYLSYYVEKDSKHVIEEGFYKEFPFTVTRFLKWTGPWGIAPGRMCWSSIVNLQYLRRSARLLGELKAFPRVKMSSSLVGRVSFKPAGFTALKNGESVEEWATVGNYAEILDETEKDRNEVRSAFFLDMLDLFGGRTTQMTATEVNARLDERLLAFSPTFCQHLNDFRPMMLRIFRLMYEAGQFGPVAAVPKELLMQTTNGGMVFNPDAVPEVVYNSKFAQLMKTVHNNGLLNSVTALGQLAQLDASVLTRFNFDVAGQELARGMDVPERFVRSDDEREAALAELQSQAMQEAVAQAGGVQAGGGAMMPGPGGAAGMQGYAPVEQSPESVLSSIY